MSIPEAIAILQALASIALTLLWVFGFFAALRSLSSALAMRRHRYTKADREIKRRARVRAQAADAFCGDTHD